MNLPLSCSATLLSTFCCLCGSMPTMETMETHEQSERTHMQYRLACYCGQTTPLWSRSDVAAVHLWNEMVAATLGKLITT